MVYSKKIHVVLLHGYGSCGENMQHLARALALPDVDFWCPDAPEICAEYPQGRQWFSLKGIDLDAQDVASIWSMIHPLLTQSAKNFQKILQEKYAHFSGPIILAGFSQGAMMAYELGFFQQKVHAVMGLAGAYCLAQKPVHKPLLFWTHAQDDGVVPLRWMQQAEALWESYELHAERYISAYGGHSMTPDAATAVRCFLEKIQKNLDIMQSNI